ncbi:MAG: hypothetical protein IT537_03645 [Hyphomicrobiales bacterium]|nr:hypothetical protein [Hyphomicrobiales bacterium]
MLAASAIESLTRSLMLGTARQPLAIAAFDGAIASDDPKASLKALALLGQFQRFRRPVAQDLDAKPVISADQSRIIPEPVRPFLRALLTERASEGRQVVTLAVADLMARRKLELHPFDLPLLEQFVKTHGALLGGSALAWAERNGAQDNRQGNGNVLSGALDESNWTLAPPMQKAEFIAGLRACDPTRARQLIETVFAQERATDRLQLMNTLASNLSESDVPFLERAVADRAPSVREAAEALLVALPGTSHANKRLSDCVAYIKRGKSGLLRRRETLQIEFPATIQEQAQRIQWANDMFGRIPLDALTRTLGFSPEEAVAAADDDPALLRVLLNQATRAQRYDLVAPALQRTPELGLDAYAWLDGPGIRNAAAVEAWCSAAIHPDLWPEMPAGPALYAIYQKTRAPLPDVTARAVLGCRAWRDLLDRSHDSASEPVDKIVHTAVLIPLQLRNLLRGGLAPLPEYITGRPLAVLSLLDQLESA